MKPEIRLFAVEYDSLDEPAIFSAYDAAHAEKSYRDLLRGWEGEDDPLKITPISPNTIITYSEDGQVVRQTAAEIARESIPGVAVLWDGHYC
jgi:hypothetical protein